jgi:hypothetical protein
VIFDSSARCLTPAPGLLWCPRWPGGEVGIVLVELGVMEQRYDVVKKGLDGGSTVTEVAERYGVTR